MNILVLLKMVPDIVEELSVAADGKSLDTEYLRATLNERDDHALEQALLLKERHGGTVTVLALDGLEVDEVLFTALAKGADRAVKLCDFETTTSTRAASAALTDAIARIPELWPVDLILTGVQAIDDLDGQLAPLVANAMNRPYLGIVTHVDLEPAGGTATAIKEYVGGVRGEFSISLPAVLGIQSADKSPRYVPVNKVLAAQKTKKIETLSASIVAGESLVAIREMAKPEQAGHAEMLEGSLEELAEQVFRILGEKSLV